MLFMQWSCVTTLYYSKQCKTNVGITQVTLVSSATYTNIQLPNLIMAAAQPLHCLSVIQDMV